MDRDRLIARFWAHIFSRRNNFLNGWRWVGLIITIVTIVTIVMNRDSLRSSSSAIDRRSADDVAFHGGLRDRPMSHRVSAGRR